MYYAILSDIHGNLFAIKTVKKDLEKYSVDGIIMLGDIIDYGMQSNEVVQYIRTHLQEKIVCNIWGNHERAILTGDYDNFASQRGVDCARYTAGMITNDTKSYLNENLEHSGMYEFSIDNKRVLAVHGSLEDRYWRSISPDNVRGDYCSYDIVFSGHSHYSHFFSKFYKADDPDRRNEHSVVFINPGSVGQPRNHNPNAQYALMDMSTGAVIMRSVPYNIDSAMALYDGNIDDFYRTRLKTGV